MGCAKKLLAAGVILAAAVPGQAFASGSPATTSGGAALGPAPQPAAAPANLPAPPPPTGHGRWLTSFTLTEYWPAPEAWFVGRPVSAPGLAAKHRIDWLYSARGVSMNGQGLGLDGQLYHIASLGTGGWVTAAGKLTLAALNWFGGPPFWRAGAYWRSARGAVTFPLAAGGWSAGAGTSYVPLPGVSFASGPARPLRFYESIAVDPGVIPRGSRVYIPAYRNDGHGGWFVAQDTGGAIRGRRIDVYRTPPASPRQGGQYLVAQRVFIAGPGR